MEFTFPSGKKIIISKLSTDGWADGVIYVATPFRTLIALTEESPERLSVVHHVMQLLGNPKVEQTAQGIRVGAQHLVVPYEGAGIIPRLALHSYDYAFYLRTMGDERNEWVSNILAQYAAHLDQSQLIAAPPGFNPNKGLVTK